jgi:hypothetical protein
MPNACLLPTIRAALRPAARMLALSLGLVLAHGAAHGQRLLFESCVDAGGNPVETIGDGALKMIAAAGLEGGRPLLRHNPELLPRLGMNERLFFNAHECARLSAGRAGAARTLADARRADCVAIASLRVAGVLADDEAVRELQAGLAFSDEEWTLLPGPKRRFELAACGAAGVIALPQRAAPTPAQLRLNTCVQSCGARLWDCQAKCTAPGCRTQCEQAWARCEAPCAQP